MENRPLLDQRPHYQATTNPYTNTSNVPTSNTRSTASGSGPQQQEQIYLPANAQPCHHLPMTIVITIICGFLNFSSLLFGIPAVVVASTALKSLRYKQYATTKTLGYVALVLCMANITYTTIIDTVVIIYGTFYRPH